MKHKNAVLTALVFFATFATGCPIQDDIYGMSWPSITYWYKIINNTGGDIAVELQPLYFNKDGAETEWQIPDPSQINGKRQVLEITVNQEKSFEGVGQTVIPESIEPYQFDDQNTALITILQDGAVRYALAGYPDETDADMNPGLWYDEPTAEITGFDAEAVPVRRSLGYGKIVHDRKIDLYHELYTDLNAVTAPRFPEDAVGPPLYGTVYYTITVNNLASGSEDVDVTLDKVINMTVRTTPWGYYVR